MSDFREPAISAFAEWLRMRLGVPCSEGPAQIEAALVAKLGKLDDTWRGVFAYMLEDARSRLLSGADPGAGMPDPGAKDQT